MYYVLCSMLISKLNINLFQIKSFAGFLNRFVKIIFAGKIKPTKRSSRLNSVFFFNFSSLLLMMNYFLALINIKLLNLFAFYEIKKMKFLEHINKHYNFLVSLELLLISHKVNVSLHN